MVTVGIIGAGLMGTACAHRLMRAGFDVLAYDIDVTRRSTIANLGARVGLSVADTAAHACMLVLAVFNTDQVEAVIEGEGGVLEALRPGAAALPVMCVSTCDPQRLAALAARVAPRGVLFVEAPISGTSRQVEAGDGVGLIGGDPAAIERAASALDAICPRRFHLGAVGNGSRAKLAVNLILGLNRAAMAEGLVLAERLGLDPVAFLEVARGSAAYSQVMDVKGELMARRQFHSPQSRVAQSLKDFRLMLEQGGAAGQELPFASVYAALLEDCVRRGEAEWDNAAIIEAIRRRATR
ncbi:MAG TPA: NAD(P)-dependent oxidoreductase [Burkholderiales bacterium]|nr:NAD(P)-dependent oxidoreductase [Burkholderiales bacterium]